MWVSILLKVCQLRRFDRSVYTDIAEDVDLDVAVKGDNRVIVSIDDNKVRAMQVQGYESNVAREFPLILRLSKGRSLDMSAVRIQSPHHSIFIHNAKPEKEAEAHHLLQQLCQHAPTPLPHSNLIHTQAQRIYPTPVRPPKEPPPHLSNNKRKNAKIKKIKKR